MNEKGGRNKRGNDGTLKIRDNHNEGAGVKVKMQCSMDKEKVNFLYILRAIQMNQAGIE